MRFFDQLKAIVDKETAFENESRKMTVLIRILCLVMMTFFSADVLVFAVIGNVRGLASCLLIDILYFVVFALSYRLRKMPVVWMFILLTGFWGAAMLFLFGPDSSFQTFPAFLIIIFFFASNNKLRYKVIFTLMTFVVYMGLVDIYGVRKPIVYRVSMTTHRYVRDSCMLVILLCICIAAYVFSNESQSMESKLIEYNKKLKEKANTDPLTGLNNRGSAMDYLAEFVKKADDTICSVCICDIDHFKRVNDTYGHDVGDLVLKAVAKVLMTCSENKAFVARWGGEEFFLAFPNMNGDEALEVLYDIQSELRKTVVMSGDQKIKVTLTYGLTEYDKNQGLDQNIKDADNKLYMGKEAGRDRIMY